MDGETWIRGLEGAAPAVPEPDWLDVLVSYEQRYGFGRGGHGGPAARALASDMGVTVDTARRYLNLTRDEPHRGRTAEAAGRLREQLHAEWRTEAEAQQASDTADILRMIDTLTPGRVQIEILSDPGNYEYRTIGPLDSMGPGMVPVAESVEASDLAEASEQLSQSILARYATSESDSRDGLGSYIRITDYTEGIAYS